MTIKYHVSDRTGVPAECTARPGKCPVNRSSSEEPETQHYDTPEEAVEAFEERNKAQEVVSVSRSTSPALGGGSITDNAKEFNKNMTPKNMNYHNDKSARMAEVSRKFRQAPYNELTHPCRNIGTINPSTFEGTGAQYVEKGDNSMVILAKSDGSGVRAIASAGEVYDNPDFSIGMEATQIKQGKTDVLRPGFRVVGYVDKQGNRFGFVPNRKIAGFVYK